MLRSDTDLGLMDTGSARILFSDTHLAMMLRSDTNYGVRYTRFARILLSDTQFAILLHSGTDLVYCTHVLLEFCFRTQLSL